MIYKVVILPRAEADLERNARWWSEHYSPAQAQRWLDTVYEQLKSLAASVVWINKRVQLDKQQTILTRAFGCQPEVCEAQVRRHRSR